MDVIFSNNVQSALEDYKESLKRYPISIERAINKFDNMLNALYGLGDNLSSPPICINKDLGQLFSLDGQPLNKNLKRLNYKDESGFQWAFACHYDYNNDVITIVKMMPSPQVKEDTFKLNNPILEFWNRLENLPKRPPII